MLFSYNDSKLPIDRPHSVTRLNSLEQIHGDNDQNNRENESSNNIDDGDDDDEPLNPFKIPTKKTKKLLWAIFLPASVLFFFTVPDCRRKRFSRFPFFFFTFLMSTVYLGALTYVLVWMVVIIGKPKIFNSYYFLTKSNLSLKHIQLICQIQ